MQYTTVINPRAKRLSLVVHPLEGLRVVMPRRLSDKYIQRMLKKYAPWIQSQTAQFHSKHEVFQKYQFNDGGVTLLQGQPHQLSFQRGHRPSASRAKNTVKNKAKISAETLSENTSGIVVDDGTIMITHSSTAVSAVKKVYLQWCKVQVRTLAEQRLSYFGELMQVQPAGLSIRGQKTMWGSCSEHGRINLNWKLICAPEYVRDYVMVHELAHIRYLNHSQRFWSVVNSVHPQAIASRRWLDRYGDLIQFVTKQFS